MKPEKLLHKHDSIPCFTGEKDNGCVECIRNKAIEDYEKFLPTEEEIRQIVIAVNNRSNDTGADDWVTPIVVAIKERIGG